jgi:hypothetical protein
LTSSFLLGVKLFQRFWPFIAAADVGQLSLKSEIQNTPDVFILNVPEYFAGPFPLVLAAPLGPCAPQSNRAQCDPPNRTNGPCTDEPIWCASDDMSEFRE